MGPGENPQQNDRVYVNGMWSGAQVYTLDGIQDISYGFSGLQVIIPIDDSVQEMKITTADYDPEFGQSAGMVAQYITKSGTNQFHGSLFYFNRNSNTFAADPITQKIAGTGPTGTGIGVPYNNFNQFGGSAGGPIKKDKVFIFGATQWNRLIQPQGVIGTIPNASWRAGDMSGVATTHPIFNPATGNPDGTGRTQYQCGGILNKMCPPFDPTSVALMALLPAAPNTGAAGATDLNYTGTIPETFNQWQLDTRGDIIASDKDKFFARWSMFKAFLNSTPLLGVAGGGPSGNLSPETGHFVDQHAAINWTHTFGGNLLSELRVGVARFRLDAFQDDSGLNTNNAVGIPNINTGAAVTAGLAGINVSAGPQGGWYMGILSGVGIPRFERTTTWEAVNNWSYMRGPHQLRFGIDIVREDFNFLATNASTRGNYTFEQLITGDADPQYVNSGLSHATFLIGNPGEFDRAIFTQFPEERQTRWGIYGQDTWRATKKLTLSLGLRWDKFTPVTPGKTGGLANFDLSTGNILLAGLGSVSRSANVYTPNLDFAPRLGLAYRLTEKTVFRAGLSRNFFGSGYDAVFYHLTSMYPITAQQTINQPSNYTGVGFFGNQSQWGSQAGPPPGTPPALPASGIMPAPNGTLMKPRPFNWLTETMDSWNAMLERQLRSDTTLTIGYVGTKGTHYSYGWNPNAANVGLGSLASRRPFAGFGLTTSMSLETNALSNNYNALQIQVKKVYSKNLIFTSNLVWQKGFGFALTTLICYHNFYGINGQVRALTFTLGHTMLIPYGKGQRWGSSASPIQQAVIGGWQFSGITSIQSGLAYDPGDCRQFH